MAVHRQWWCTTSPTEITEPLEAETATKLDVPAAPAEITGVRGDADTAILAALLTALDDLGLITDATTAGT